MGERGAFKWCMYLFELVRSARHHTLFMSLSVVTSQVGKFADLVLWNPAFFGAKPDIIIKGGQIAWAQMGEYMHQE